MSLITTVLNIFLSLDTNLINFVSLLGWGIYPFLFGIIFIETGIIVFPFLPGDSLIFVAGTLASIGIMNIWILFAVLLAAAIIGDSVNYSIGKFIGPKLFNAKDNVLFKHEYLMRAKDFYDRRGGVAIFLARFVPIVRTFAPFVAGMTNMNYSKFIYYNVLGGLTWVLVNLFAGYFLGNLPIVKENFNLVLLIIIIVSMLPILFDHIREQINKRRKPKSL